MEVKLQIDRKSSSESVELKFVIADEAFEAEPDEEQKNKI